MTEQEARERALRDEPRPTYRVDVFYNSGHVGQRTARTEDEAIALADKLIQRTDVREVDVTTM